MDKTVLIEGMMCMHCRQHVEDALKALNLDVEVSLEEKKATIRNCEVADEDIINAVEDAGYEVKEIING